MTAKQRLTAVKNKLILYLSNINTSLVAKGASAVSDIGDVSSAIDTISTGGGLKYATGTFTLTTATTNPVIDWNLDFLPSAVIVRVENNHSAPSGTGNESVVIFVKGDYYSGNEVGEFWNFFGSNNYIAYGTERRPNGPYTSVMELELRIKRTYIKLPYRSANYPWKANVEYRWYAIEGVQGT